MWTAPYNAAQPRSSKLPMDSTAVFQIPIWPDMQCGDDRYISSNGFGVLERHRIGYQCQLNCATGSLLFKLGRSLVVNNWDKHAMSVRPIFVVAGVGNGTGMACSLSLFKSMWCSYSPTVLWLTGTGAASAWVPIRSPHNPCICGPGVVRKCSPRWLTEPVAI